MYNKDFQVCNVQYLFARGIKNLVSLKCGHFFVKRDVNHGKVGFVVCSQLVCATWFQIYAGMAEALGLGA